MSGEKGKGWKEYLLFGIKQQLVIFVLELGEKELNFRSSGLIDAGFCSSYHQVTDAWRNHQNEVC